MGAELGPVPVHPQPEPPRQAGRLHLAALPGQEAGEPQGDQGTHQGPRGPFGYSWLEVMPVDLYAKVWFGFVPLRPLL